MQDVDINASYIKEAQRLSTLRAESFNYEKVNETELLKLKVDNLKKYNDLREESAKKLAAQDLVYTKENFDAKKKQLEDQSKEELDKINKKYKAEQDAIEKQRAEGKISDADAAAQIALSKQKQADDLAASKKRQKQDEEELNKKYKLGQKLKAKQDKENQAAAFKMINDEAKERGLKGKQAQEFIADRAKELGLTDKDGKAISVKQAKKEESKIDAAEKIADVYKQMASLAKQLDSKITDIANSQTSIDTRLQGSNNKTKRTITGARSYWMQLSDTITGAVGVSPFVKQSDVVNKVKEMINSGIAFDVEQRAFLATISDKIATTFDATDSTLLRLIRLQQQDSTAARLGMESAMTAFLNNMYENTEYLESLSKSVRSQLNEAEALMSTEQAVEFEFQVQKWLGSMYSVGLSDSAVSSLSEAIGKLASGDISGITGGGASNLLVMAAAESGLNLTQMLKDGLDASQTNTLLQAVVNYLANMYNETQGNKLMMQQFASIYNLTASDLKAITNLANDNNQTINAISNNNLTFATAYNRLMSMANTMYQRMSLGGMMENVWDNFNYTMAEGIAASPALYSVYKAAGLLDDMVGGIALPDIKVLGTGVNLQTTVADLMRVGAMSGSILSGIAKMITAGSGGGFNAKAMLSAFGVDSSLKTLSRGSGAGLATSGVTVSSSGYIGNAEEGAVYNKTMSDANDSSKKQMASAKEEEGSDTTNKTIDEHIVQIYSLLQRVVDGTASFNVITRASNIGWQP